MKISVVHPGVPPFTKQVVRAFYEEDFLDFFFTTFVANSNSVLQNFTNRIGSLFNYDINKQLTRREFKEIPSSKINTYQFGEIVRTLSSRAGVDARVIDFIFDWNIKSFCNHVGKRLGSIDVIYGYEYCCLETFETAKKRNILRVYDVPSPEHDYVSKILDEEFNKYNDFQTPHYKYTKKFQVERTQRRRNEWELADLVIANSEFTKQSYAKAGLNIDKVRVIPYGCPEIINKKSENFGSKVNFLWAGTFGIRKGAHYLIEALKKLDSKDYHLNIFGAWNLPSSALSEIPGNVKISKTVPYTELSNIYLNSDILVFPTICDGFGMVISEALSHGLPVITTDRAGGADLINNGENGFIIESASSDSIAEIMDWCVNNKEKLRGMRGNALETAKSWQWKDYRENILSALGGISLN